VRFSSHLEKPKFDRVKKKKTFLELSQKPALL